MKAKPFYSMLVLGCGLALAVRAENLRNTINPALLYNQAFLVAPDWSRSDSDYVFANNWQGQKLPERLGNLLAAYDNQFRLVRQAGCSTAPCDWGIDLSIGPATLLPQLARAKAVAVTTRLRVPWHLQNGRHDLARDEWLAAFALARNVSRDGTLISTLVQIAMESIQCSTLAANFGQFSTETLQQLANGLEALPARRTVADCLPTEKAFFLDWTRRKVLELQQQHPGNDARVMEEIHKLLGYEDQSEGRSNLWQRVMQASGGTSDGVLKLLRDREQFYDSTVEFLSLPYPEFAARANSFREEVEHSPNPFVAETIPSFIRAREREFRILATLAIVRAGLEFKLHGDVAFNRISDPCGHGPLAFRRFAFEGVDRGFEIRSVFDLAKNQAVLVFVEQEGPPFQVDGNYPGRPIPPTTPKE